MERSLPQPSRRSSRIQVWLRPIINPDGTVENITQGFVENQGPQKGHWAVVDGKRRWIEGQHNYNRQLDPKSHEAILGSRVMNKNPEMKHYLKDDGTPVSELVEDGRIVRLGRTVIRHETFFDKGFDDSLARAKRIVSSATKSKVQGGENTGVGTVGAVRK